MITKFKIFENLEDSSKLSVGDYVMFSDVDGFNKNFNNFMNNNIGKINSIKGNYIDVEFTSVPSEIESMFRKNIVSMHVGNIYEFGKTPEEIELKIAANKYNL